MNILVQLTRSKIRVNPKDKELISYLKKYANSNVIETTRLLRSYFNLPIQDNEYYVGYIIEPAEKVSTE